MGERGEGAVRRFKVDYHSEVIQGLVAVARGLNNIHSFGQWDIWLIWPRQDQRECTDVQRSGRVRGARDG